MNSISFRRGRRQVPLKDKDSLIKGIMRILNVNTVQSYYRYERGDGEPKMSQARAIEKLFEKKYGITDIWGKR